MLPGGRGCHPPGLAGGVRVAPFGGHTPGTGMFCEACGRSLSGVERLPTRAEWEASRPASLADRCAEATAAFLAAMREAGDPGSEKTPGLKRKQRAWILRPVHRAPDVDPLHYEYEPGLALTTEGSFHRIGSAVRGWGQARFPVYADTADPEAIEPPAEARLIDELAAVLRAHGVTA